MLIRRVFAAALVSTLAAPLAWAGAPPDVDLTGTWQATFSCKAVSFAGESEKFAPQFTIETVQVGSLVYSQFTPTAPTATGLSGPRGVGGDTGPLCGMMTGIVGKPGKARLNYTVGSGPIAVESYAMPVIPATVDLGGSVGEPNGKGVSGKLTGTALMDFVGTLYVGPGFGSCKVKMERVSTDAPTLLTDVQEICDFVFSALPLT